MIRPLCVIHLDTNKTWRGGERQLFWLAWELEKRGHRSWVACGAGSALQEKARCAGLMVFSVSPWGEADVFAAARLRNLIRDEKISILHAHTGHAVGVGAMAVLGTSAKLVATRRVDFPLNRNIFSRWKYGRVNAFAAISGRVKEILEAGGIASQKIAVIPDGIDPSGYPLSSADRQRLRKEKGFSQDEPLVVNAAALVPHKDQSALLRAAQTVCRELPAARFLILGDGPLRSALEKQATDLGVAASVNFLGYRKDVLDFIALSDVFVFSSIEEGFGTSILDAMAIGVPTVATAAGGIPDIYGGPEGLVQPGNAAELAQQLLLVLRDKEEAARRVKRGCERAAQFTVQKMTEGYENFYQNLLTGNT